MTGFEPATPDPQSDWGSFSGIASECHGRSTHPWTLAISGFQVFTAVPANARCPAILLPLCYHRMAGQRVDSAPSPSEG